MDRGADGMMSPAVSPTPPSRARTANVAGAVVLGCCAGWALVSATGRTSRPEGVLLAVLAVAAGYACGRIAGSLLPVAAAAAAALGGLGLALLSPGDGLSPGGGPPERMGPGTAELTLAAGAACCAAWAVRPGWRRSVLHLPAAGAAAAGCLLVGPAAAVPVVLVVLGSLAAGRVRRLPGLAALALIAAAAAGCCWALGAGALPPGLLGAFQDHPPTHRIRLWHQAVRLAAAHPLRGVGPGRFGELTAGAAGPDGTAHSALLQQAAEQGLPGVVLLGAVFGWLLYALWRSPRATPLVLAAGAALTALAVESMAGEALGSPRVTACAGLLAGLATARRADAGETGVRVAATGVGLRPAGPRAPEADTAFRVVRPRKTPHPGLPEPGKPDDRDPDTGPGRAA
ncbi:O-antigen ligase family protein [Streptomyces palmae]|uniref:O-antigen ligase family protein n=1 Tax=Streptomyces palmae TaxID=1701085 RepID=A0A4Z0H5X3_9ACTN|nr:O-antigen ligase family protein [Streptomyces palmae]TGB07502.1 O-antigen ligase family protein [Streptomyces palmae]